MNGNSFLLLIYLLLYFPVTYKVLNFCDLFSTVSCIQFLGADYLGTKSSYHSENSDLDSSPIVEWVREKEKIWGCFWLFYIILGL